MNAWLDRQEVEKAESVLLRWVKESITEKGKAGRILPAHYDKVRGYFLNKKMSLPFHFASQQELS
jgi:hypothetical protein